MQQKRWDDCEVIATLCNLFRNGYGSATVPLRDHLRDKLLSEIYFRKIITKKYMHAATPRLS